MSYDLKVNETNQTNEAQGKGGRGDRLQVIENGNVLQ